MNTTNVSTDRKQGICPLADYDGKESFAEVLMALEDEHPYVRFAQAHCASWRESPVNIIQHFQRIAV